MLSYSLIHMGIFIYIGLYLAHKFFLGITFKNSPTSYSFYVIAFQCFLSCKYIFTIHHGFRCFNFHTISKENRHNNRIRLIIIYRQIVYCTYDFNINSFKLFFSALHIFSDNIKHTLC